MKGWEETGKENEGDNKKEEIHMSLLYQSLLIIHRELQKVLRMCVCIQSSALLLEPMLRWGKKSPTVSLKDVVSFHHLIHI